MPFLWFLLKCLGNARRFGDEYARPLDIVCTIGVVAVCGIGDVFHLTPFGLYIWSRDRHVCERTLFRQLKAAACCQLDRGGVDTKLQQQASVCRTKLCVRRSRLQGVSTRYILTHGGCLFRIKYPCVLPYKYIKTGRDRRQLGVEKISRIRSSYRRWSRCH